MQKLILPLLLVPFLVIFFGSKPTTEIGVHFSKVEYIKPLKTLKMASVKVLELAPLPYLPIGSHPNSYAPRNCTWGVASMKPSVPGNWGDAREWPENARKVGITVSSTPIVGAVGIDTAGYYGHAVTIIGVGDGTVTVEEMNFDWHGGIRSFTYPTSRFVYIWV